MKIRNNLLKGQILYLSFLNPIPNFTLKSIPSLSTTNF